MHFLWAMEFGSAGGHISLAQTVGAALISHGHQVTVVGPGMESPPPDLQRLGISCLPGPRLAKDVSRPAANHADLLLSHGYSDADLLRDCIGQWAQLFSRVRPDRVIVESAPTPSLAARLIGVPVVALDTGFMMPPIAKTLPAFRPWVKRQPGDLESREAHVLAMINKAISKTAPGIQLESLSKLFDFPTLWLTWPELNHFGQHSTHLHLGPVDRDRPYKAMPISPGNNDFATAYLRFAGNYEHDVLMQVLSVGMDVHAYMPQADISVVSRLSKHPLFHLSYTPIALDFDIKPKILLSNGNIGIVQQTIAQGIPQVMLPIQAEQWLFSDRVSSHGLGVQLERHLGLQDLNASQWLNKKNRLAEFLGKKESLRKNTDQLIINLCSA